MTRDHFLVSFGREPGGLLEFLGLPETATAKEIGDRLAGAEAEIQLRSKKKRAEVRQEAENGTITEAERDERIAKAKEEESAATIRLRDLSKSHTAQQAQKRSAAKENHAIVTAGWVELAGVDVTEDFLLARRPLPRIEEADLAKLREKPVEKARTTAEVSRWRVRRDLLPLLEADRVWSDVEGTDRVYWQQTIARWRQEIEAAEPHFAGDVTARPAGPEFPHLARGRSLAVAKLDVTETPETQERTRRRPTEPVPFSPRSLAELLRAMGDEPAGDANAGQPLDIQTLLRLLADEPPPPAPTRRRDG